MAGQLAVWVAGQLARWLAGRPAGLAAVCMGWQAVRDPLLPCCAEHCMGLNTTVLSAAHQGALESQSRAPGGRSPAQTRHAVAYAPGTAPCE